jgi:hypothetical protein
MPERGSNTSWKQRHESKIAVIVMASPPFSPEVNQQIDEIGSSVNPGKNRFTG